MLHTVLRPGSFTVRVLDNLSDFCTPSFGPPAVTGAQFDPSGGQEVWARIAESSSSSSTTGQKVQVSSFRQADADSDKHVPSQSSPPAVTGDQLDPAGSQDHRACISSNAVQCISSNAVPVPVLAPTPEGHFFDLRSLC